MLNIYICNKMLYCVMRIQLWLCKNSPLSKPWTLTACRFNDEVELSEDEMMGDFMTESGENIVDNRDS